MSVAVLDLLTPVRVGAAAAALAAITLLMRPIRRRIRMAVATLLGLVAAVGLSLAATDQHWRDLAALVRCEQPLLLVVPCVVLAIALVRTRTLPRSHSPARRWTFWSFATLAATSAAIAVSQPEWGHAIDRLTVVLAMDRSRSTDLVDNANGRERDEEYRALGAMRDEDRVARVVFGATAATEDPAHPRNAVGSAQEIAVARDGTDFSAAIRRALAEIPNESAGRIVLVTDGASNRGDALAAATSATAAGVPIDVLLLPHHERANVRVDSVRLPASADEGETFDLRIVTHSSTPADVDVRISIDGTLVQTGSAHIEAGEDVITLRQTAPSPGLHRYEVDVSAHDPSRDTLVQDNRAGSFLRVRGPARVLVLEGDPGHGGPLSAALSSAGFRTEERTATSFPESLAALAAYDLVVLSDIPARALAPEQMDQIATYVRDLGGGLLLMGGDRSMGPGGYSRTPIEEISPVAFDMRQERRRASLAQVIAIDFSGSMAATVPTGQTKLQLANEAAARSAMLLGAGDRLGVMHVDTMPHWTVPIQPIASADNLQNIVQHIRAVGPSGGGIIIPVTLTEAYRALAEQNANLRHLLLFADGSDSEEIQGQAVVVAAAYQRGITTSVVSMGNGSDTPELEHLSREGHGRFYLVEDATRLPAVFAQETVLAARSSIREEPFRPTLGAPDVITRGIDFASGPPLRGWVVTIPKPRASILLTGTDHDPILATWQIGVGHVGAFMSDAKDRWGAEWLAWPDASRLWAELARALVRRPDPLVRVEADTEGGVLHVHADARSIDGYADSLRRLTAVVSGPDGRSRELALDPIGAGSYSAETLLDRDGPYAIGVRDDAHGTIVATGGALLLEGEELRPARDPHLVERIVSMTGGRIRTSLADVFRDRGGLRRAYTPLAPWLLALAAAAMFLALLARRLAMPEALERVLEARASTQRARARVATEASRTAEATVSTLLARKQRPAAPRERSAVASDESAAPIAPVVPPPVAPPRIAPAPETNAAPAARTPEPASTKPGESGTGSANLDALLAKKRARRG